MCAVHKARLDELEVDRIASEWVKCNESRARVFGNMERYERHPTHQHQQRYASNVTVDREPGKRTSCRTICLTKLLCFIFVLMKYKMIGKVFFTALSVEMDGKRQQERNEYRDTGYDRLRWNSFIYVGAQT